MNTTKAEAIFNTISIVDAFENLGEEELNQYYNFLDEISESQNMVLMILNKVTLKYEHVTPNFNQFWGLESSEVIDSFKDFFPKVLEDFHPLEECIKVHEELMQNFTADERMYFNSTFFGAKAKTKQGNSIRIIWHVIPLVLNGQKQSKILLSYMKDVTHLSEGDNYWFRIQTPNNTYCWFSDSKNTKKKDIISKTELLCIKLWASGKKIDEIAEKLFISKNTVNNHLKAIRNRLSLRSNTAIVEICNLLHI
ncbi:MAG: helix-turn-helix transcriptional regulator [Chitinophagales bacterium]|nr:helix-turn-helix transcriptional regulator [Chitinophagales bacterium]